jgi:hypothetical protein
MEVMDRRAVDLIYAPPKAEEIRKKSKKSGRKATKIRFNPRNPQNPGPHPSTRGVAEQIQNALSYVWINLISIGKGTER